MTQYYIIEIQQNAAGEYGHIVHWAFDEDPDLARLKAESKYHEIMAAAAVSETKKHSAVILSDEAFPVMNHCYKHPNVTAPVEPESEPEEEDEEEPVEEDETPAEGNSEGGEGA